MQQLHFTVANLNSRDPKLYEPMVNLVDLLLRYNADVDSLATEIAFAESDSYRTSSPLCQAAKVPFLVSKNTSQKLIFISEWIHRGC